MQRISGSDVHSSSCKTLLESKEQELHWNKQMNRKNQNSVHFQIYYASLCILRWLHISISFEDVLYPEKLR